jgi:drug/metabolite transporter (DMT)-like permease
MWGTIPLMLRAADGASVVKVFFRVLSAGAVIGIWLLATGKHREIATLGWRKIGQVVLQGLILTLNWVLFFSALDMTNVATAELLGYTGPVFVAALAPFITGETFDRRVIGPLALALGGIVVILAPQGLALANSRQLMGAGLAFLSAATYATLLLRSKRILRGISSASLMLIEYGVASVAVLPLVIAAYARGNVPSTPKAYAALFALGVIQTALAGFVFLSGLRRVRTDHAAILTYVEPVSAVMFAALFLGEPLTWTTALGGAMVVGGGAFVAQLEAREGVEAVSMEAVGVECENAEADGCTPPEGT